MATSYLFTDPAKQLQGFFLSFGTGINFVKWEVTAYNGSGNTYIRSSTQAEPGFDLGIGGQFKKKRIASRVTAGYQNFLARVYSDTRGKNISLFYLKISLGF